MLGHRFVPFGLHQIADYIFGGGLVLVGVHSYGRMSIVLIVVGALWCIVGVVSRGPLSVSPFVSRRLHGISDLALVVALVVSPLVALNSIDPVAVGVAEAVALVMGRVSLWTVYAPPALTGAPATRDGAASMPPERPTVAVAARAAGRGAGVARRRAAAAGSAVGPALDRGARRLGRAFGNARRPR